MEFVHATKGELSLSLVVQDMLDFMQEEPNMEHRITIGSDSQNQEQRRRTTFVTAVICHRVGKGARYYVHRRSRPLFTSMRQRMFTETSYSLLVCSQLSELFADMPDPPNLEVHLDVGPNGATQSLIKELLGWVEGSGYEAKIKPHAFAASKVADRYTRV